MRQRGKITEWKDERGFGFITTVASDRQAFVHIRSFANRNRRPQVNDMVTYEWGTDERGRPQAVQVEFVGDDVARARRQNSARNSIVMAAGFLSVLGAAVVGGFYPSAVFVFYLGASLVSFLAYWFDKAAARASRWRTAENTLHGIDLIGGWPGGLVAMQVFRHKSSKASFRQMFWLTAILNCGALAWLATSSGTEALWQFLGKFQHLVAGILMR